MYYVDGFHGGVDGHMPVGALRDILVGLDTHPQWKVSFEIETYSWPVEARRDPESLRRLQALASDPTTSARVEIISGAYAQPFAWQIGGESVIRQLQHGLEQLRSVFPEACVDTYAVQEPCWTSCLPQLLRSLGYHNAVLKNSTCWGGYAAPVANEDLIQWVGPDGSSITAVPRYRCEELCGSAEQEGTELPPGYESKCRDAGIRHPVGTRLQDMGWTGVPWNPGLDARRLEGVTHVTWRQYVRDVATQPTMSIRLGQEDVRPGLVWGAAVMQQLGMAVRSAENRLIQAEKMAAMAAVRGQYTWPGEQLREAWGRLLFMQHHDAWIVPYNRLRGGTWASEVQVSGCLVQTMSRQIVDAATLAMGHPAPSEKSSDIHVRVYNTAGWNRRDLASIEVAADSGTCGFRVLDAAGATIPCQVEPSRRYADKTINAAKVLFMAEVPAMGYSTYRICPLGTVVDQVSPMSVQTDGHIATLESDLYRIVVDLDRGGCLQSLYAKQLGRELVDIGSGRGLLNEYRGYFPDQGGWLSTADQPAQLKVLESGPVRLVVAISGTLGTCGATTILTLIAGQPRIDFEVKIDLPTCTYEAASNKEYLRIGEPWDPACPTIHASRRPFYDDAYKLQALFPVSIRGGQIYKNAPFDVCHSQLADTRFCSWHTLKHNVVLNWVDLFGQQDGYGVALLTDHTTAYVHGQDRPLGLVLAYSGPGIWHDYPLDRKPHTRYSLIPHAGRWDAAGIWQQSCCTDAPLVAQIVGCPQPGDTCWSLLDVTGTGYELTAALVEGESLVVRLFNAEGDESAHELVFCDKPTDVELVELDGRVVSRMPVACRQANRWSIRLVMPRFGVRTLRIRGFVRA